MTSCPPGGPLGYGSGGVYALDENLRPVKKLIDVGMERFNNRPWPVWLAAGDEKTVCILIRIRLDSCAPGGARLGS